MVYVLAMFAHAAEWAAARRLGPAEEGERSWPMFRPPSGRSPEASSTRVEPLDNRRSSACALSPSTGATSPRPTQKIIRQPAGESSSSAGWVLR